MCWQDKQIGRATKSTVRHVDLFDISQNVLPVSPLRTNIIFCSPVDGYITVTTEHPAVLGQGLNIYKQEAPTIVDVETYGQATMDSWYGVASISTTHLTIFESYCDWTPT